MTALIKDFGIFQYAYEKCIENELYMISMDSLLSMLDMLTGQAVEDLISCRNTHLIPTVLNYNVRRQSEIKQDYYTSSESDSEAEDLDSGYTSNFNNDDSDYY